MVAELDGQIVGSNFLDERSVIAGIGPISVDPPVMNRTIGRQLMQAVMDRATERRFPGVRLVQIAWHYRSLALYTKLGFDTRETLSAMQGTPLALRIPSYGVRRARDEDLAMNPRLATAAILRFCLLPPIRTSESATSSSDCSAEATSRSCSEARHSPNTLSASRGTSPLSRPLASLR